MIRLYINPPIGTVRLQALCASAITKLYRELLTSGGRKSRPLAANTVKHVHTVLRKALFDAVLVDELLPNNPAERAKLPRVQATEPGMVWAPAQLRAFLVTAGDHRLFAFFHLAAYTGARRGELLNLRWRDVDLDKPQIHITGTAAVIDRQRVEGTTKSGRSRVVSLDPGTVKVLKAHRARQDEDRLKLGESWKGGNAYVFTTGWGDPLFPDTPSSLMPKLIETHNKQNPRGQLPHACLHDLRHIHATTLLLAGVPVHVVAARLGHADPAITLRVYAHVIHEQAATAADVFAKAVNG
ncbi:site-specific integrase [Nonomuraea sp. NPDC049750]|uniref:tyrosine-type recombinase/integrase n=1 Tax=Nonomuraea sp. NPDC049750 TaxID=3154738 RepID=UPI0033C3FBDE